MIFAVPAGSAGSCGFRIKRFEELVSAREHEAVNAAEIEGEEDGAPKKFSVHLGLAVTCGAEENVIPFLSNRLSVEYEITRSIRSVAQTKRRKLGVLKTDLDLMGGFDMQAMRSLPPWKRQRAYPCRAGPK